MQRYPSVVLWICAAVFLVTGLAFSLMPRDLFGDVGLEVPNGSALTELRAMYGGLELAVGLFLAVCARRGGEALELGLLLSFLTLLGLASFRGVGMVLETPQLAVMSTLLILESVGAVFALSGLLVLRKQTLQT